MDMELWVNYSVENISLRSNSISKKHVHLSCRIDSLCSSIWSLASWCMK
jgi:hypothetical protein